MYSLKIPKVSQAIDSCLAAIIQDNDNDNIMQVYVEISLDLNLNFYIRSLFKPLLQLSALFYFIIKVMKLLYSKSKANNHYFAIY